jgi:hypothetical protein
MKPKQKQKPKPKQKQKPKREPVVKTKGNGVHKSKLDRVSTAGVVQMLGRLGATDTQMAEALGISRNAFRQWRDRNPKLLATLKESKDQADEAVVKSLYQRAKGYDCPATKFITVNGNLVTKEYIEHYPPDTTACIFWLKNRKPAQWRDSSRTEVVTPEGESLTMTLRVTQDELPKLKSNALQTAITQTTEDPETGGQG